MHCIPTIDMVRTGQNILRLRKQAGISVKDIQTELGLATPQAVYKWQQGVTLPSIDNMVILARLFGVSIEEILVIKQSG